MTKMRCYVCHEVIPNARVKAIPGVRTCVQHSDAKPVEGIMEYGHKTAGVICLLPKDPEQRRRALRAYRRSR